MQIAILSIAIILGMVVFVSMRSGGSASSGVRKRNRRTGYGGADPFHAVSINPVGNGCQAVESLGLQRFLSEDAPALPLADCNAQDCACKYIHHTDRRSGTRERRGVEVEQSEETEFWRLRNRRNVAGRRHQDRHAA
jgi:hypothetical protein